MDDIMKIVKSFEEAGLLIKIVTRQLKVKQKTEMWISWDAMLGNMVAWKEAIPTKASNGTVRARRIFDAASSSE